MPNNTIGWGQGSVNNSNGWGKGASNSADNWGDIHGKTFGHDETNLTGGGGFTGLLDDYSGVAGWSLDQIKLDATASIRVRRSSDNAEQDIGFVDNTLDTASLLSFVGANDGFVTVIYDQNGTGHHHTQTNPVRQGRIVIGGVLQTLNGKPVVLRSTDPNGGYLAPTLDFIGDTNIYGSYWVTKRPNSGNFALSGSEIGGTDYGYIGQAGGSSTVVNATVTPSNERLNGASWAYSTRGDVYNDLANQSLFSAGIQFNYAFSGYSLGYRYTNPSNFGIAQFQEHVILTDNSNQLAVEANINARWNVF